MEKLREKATQRPYVAMYDISLSIPSLVGDPYGFLFDSLHPADLGYAFVAQLTQTALSPS